MRRLPPIADLLAALVLMIGGSAILLFGMPRELTPFGYDIELRKLGSLGPPDPAFPRLKSRYQIQKVDRYAVLGPSGGAFSVDIAHYLKKREDRQALVFVSDPAGAPSTAATVNELNRRRSQAWSEASQFLRQLPGKQRIFLTWWDNAQRIDLLNGEKVWIDAPPAEAFEASQRVFWKKLSGGFAESKEPLSQLAAWYLSDAESALKGLNGTFGNTADLYFLVSIDDLWRLSEMKALSRFPAPFESRVFTAAADIHRLISSVKRWAREKGRGSYLLQPLGNFAIRVWRINTRAGERTLLARLLPFTSSLAKPLKRLELLHRSKNTLLSIYRWNPPPIETSSSDAVSP